MFASELEKRVMQVIKNKIKEENDKLKEAHKILEEEMEEKKAYATEKAVQAIIGKIL